MQRARCDFTKWLKYIFFCLLSVVLWTVPSGAAAQADNFSIGTFVKVGEKRISRTVYEYTYQAVVTNIGPPMASVAAVVASRSPNTTIVAGTLNFANVAYLRPTSSTNTFTIRQDRIQPFDWNNLTWTFTSVPLDDMDATTSKFILAADGGSITATNTRGDQVTLEIPPGALAASELIKLTMLENPQASPIANLQFPGVYIEPHGLILKNPVKLKVVLTNPLSDPALASLFLLKSATLPLGISNVTATANGLEGEVIHFSTYIGGTPTQDELNAMWLQVTFRNPTYKDAKDLLNFFDDLGDLINFQRYIDLLGGTLSINIQGFMEQFVNQLLSSTRPNDPSSEYVMLVLYLSRLVDGLLSDHALAEQLRSWILIDRLNITPRISHLYPGSTVTLRATSTDMYGNASPVSVTWTSSNPAIAACSSSTGTQTEVATSDTIDNGEAVITAHYEAGGLSLESKVVINRPDIVGYSTGPGTYESHGWLISKGTVVEWPPPRPLIPHLYQRGWYWPTGINNNGVVLSLLMYERWDNVGAPYGFSYSFVYDGDPVGQIECSIPSLAATGINDSNVVVAYFFPNSIADVLQNDQRRFRHVLTETWMYRLTPHAALPNIFQVDTITDMSQLPAPPGSSCGFAPTGMNNKGLIIGWSWCQGTGYVIDASRFMEILLRGRSIYDLDPSNPRFAPIELLSYTPLCIPLPALGVDGHCGIPTGINDAGDIVGYYVVPGTNVNHGFVLRSYEVVPEYLPDPPNKNGWRPTGINNSGQIIGHSGTDGYLLDDGGFTSFGDIVPMALTK